MENACKSNETVEDLFFKFMDAQDCPEITSVFRQLVKLLGIESDNPREFYSLLKGKLQSWRCKSLWELLDSRANQKEYGKGKICEDTQVLIIGAGPIGLRTAIEVALLGARVVIVEKRESFERNNVLHLWPFLLTDFRSLGAKKFYGKFCSGSIDHISIRRLQSVLLKTALIFGAKLYAGVTFEHVIEPNSLEDGWKCKVSPVSHPVSEYEFDVLIGADGKKNIIPGFQQIEMRGTLAIGITANFVNHCTEEEANVEEISGIAYQFNPQFFDDLFAQKGIKLENIVYYKDETHYFVMTAGKASLLKRGALKEDVGPSSKLLSPSNIDRSKLLEYVTDVVKYATKGTLRNLELKIVGNNQPDIAAFDFTSIKKAEHAARIIERKGSKLLVGLVGDSLLEPFWPTGSGCARGVLSALDAAWMIRSFAQDKPPLQILSERENIYRLLSGTSSENLHKDHVKYTINPTTRYLHITHKRIREVYHLFDTDDPVNADFSVGSPQTTASSKASRRRRISTGAKFTSSKGRRRGRASSHLAADFATDRMRSTSGSSVENLACHKPLSSTQSVPLDSANPLSAAGSDDEVFQAKTRRVKIKDSAIPLTRRGRSSTVGSSGDELKDPKKKAARKRSISKDNPENLKENTRRKRGFFGFGKSKPKRKSTGDSDYQSDKDSKSQKVKHGEQQEQRESKFVNEVTLKSVRQREEEKPAFVREDSWKRRPAGSFSREQYTRRSARDIIREMEARSKGEAVPNENITNERLAGKGFDSKGQEKPSNGELNSEGEKNRRNKNDNREVEEKAKIKKEDEKKKQKEEEKRRKEEERKRKDEEKRKHEEEKKRKEEEERKRKKKEEEVKKREQEKNLHNKKTTQSKQQTTPPNKKSKKQRLLDEIAALSPSAKRALPVLSTLSPELEKENEKVPEHSVTSAVRDAAMLVMATPLLIDGMIPKIGMDRKGSWLGRSNGRVRDVVNRYNTLNDMKPIIDKMNGNATPLKRPTESVDGSEGNPQILDVDIEDGNGNEAHSEKMDGSRDVKPTPPSEKRKTLQLKQDQKHLISSPSLERLKLKLQDDTSTVEKNSSPSSPNGQRTKDFNSPIWQKTVIAEVTEHHDKSKENEPAQISKAKEEDTVDGTSTLGIVSTQENDQIKKDFSSPIWQKTAIAVVTENNTENKENSKDSSTIYTKNEEANEKQPLRTKLSQRRRSSVLPSELMDEKLKNLLNSTTAQRAKESIKYMISLFKQIQKHPNDERYYRIFKGRARFRKHVWSMRNAKLFMTSSGWTEIGSFIIFPLSKQIEGPLLLLHKYLSITEEETAEENSSTRKADPSNLRRASSTDLAERIMELKEALASSRTNSCTTKRSSSNTKSMDWKLLQRTVSLDEVNILKAKTGESRTSLMRDRKSELSHKLRTRLVQESKSKPNILRRSVSENALLEPSEICGNLEPAFPRFTGKNKPPQKLRTHLDQADEKKPSNLRRSVSENALLESSETCDDLEPAFSRLTGKNESPKKQRSHLYQADENKPSNLRRSVSENALLASSETSESREPPFSAFIRRFSQRGVKEQEVSCDLVMENPLNSEIAAVSEKQWHRNSSSSDEDDFPKSNVLSVQPERQEVRSPQEAVLEEADQLSSVLGNLIDTLGSSTDTERESESERETKNEPKASRKAKDEHKDEELEALCETLDLLIHDNSSDSSSESSKENVRERKPYSRKQAEWSKSGFKPPMPSTKRTTQQLGKAKSLDNFKDSKRSSTANGGVNRERISKSKSVDVAALTSNIGPKERTTASRQSVSKTIQKNKTERQGSSLHTRVQRQKESSNNDASHATNREESLPNKRDSGAMASQRTTAKRPATKSKSVDMERSRTHASNRKESLPNKREPGAVASQRTTAKRPATKSKSVDMERSETHATNRKESLPNKRESGAMASQRTTAKRPATKSKSVDMERSRTRPPVAKTKSVDHRRNAIKITRKSQVTNGSGRLSSGGDDKKPPRLITTEQSRMKTRSQSSGKGNSRASLAKNSKDKTEDTKNNEPSKPRHENDIPQEASAQRSSQEDDSTVYVSVDENTLNDAENVALPDKTSSDHVIEDQDITDAGRSTKSEPVEEIAEEDASCESANQETNSAENGAHPNGDVRGERGETNKLGDDPKVKQIFSSNVELRKLVQDSEENLTANGDSCHKEINSQWKEDNPSIMNTNSDFTESPSENRKMTLLDLGKQQSKQRLNRKEVASLSLDERKQLIMDAAVTKPKSKPADKRRSILQIKSRSDGNLVKSKKEAFEKPKVAHTASDSSVAKSSRQRHFRFRGRKKKSFEFSSAPLEVVTEDQEEIFEEALTANGIKTATQQARDNGVTTERKNSIGEKIEKVEREKGHSPVKISPFQLHFTKRKGSYDLEKRASSGSMESPKTYSGECE